MALSTSRQQQAFEEHSGVALPLSSKSNTHPAAHPTPLAPTYTPTEPPPYSVSPEYREVGVALQHIVHCSPQSSLDTTVVGAHGHSRDSPFINSHKRLIRELQENTNPYVDHSRQGSAAKYFFWFGFGTHIVMFS